MILPEASCDCCRKITGQIEDICANSYFRLAKAHFDLRGAKQKKARHFVRTEISYLGHSLFEKIPVHEHPGFFPVFSFGPPGILTGRPPEAPLLRHLEVVPLHEDTEKRSAKHSHKPIVISRELVAETYARLLAKIAHGFAVAELGFDTFEPYLPDLIRDPKSALSFYIGGKVSEFPLSGGLIPHPERELHQLSFEPPPAERPELILVRIRLFALIRSPVHYVVAGRKLAASTSC
jgi:hypothetical protein